MPPPPRPICASSDWMDSMWVQGENPRSSARTNYSKIVINSKKKKEPPGPGRWLNHLVLPAAVRPCGPAGGGGRLRARSPRLEPGVSGSRGHGSKYLVVSLDFRLLPPLSFPSRKGVFKQLLHLRVVHLKGPRRGRGRSPAPHIPLRKQNMAKKGVRKKVGWEQTRAQGG